MIPVMQTSAEAQKITLIGAILDALLGIVKILAGSLAHSTALIADGIHSLSDLLTDFMVYIILKFSHQAPDKEHPWGHARFETLGTIILGGLLILVAGGIAYNSLQNLLSNASLPVPEWPTLLVAAVSVAAKEWIYRYTLAVGKRLKSDLLIANAWHSRTDALSSVIVFVGIAGAMSGFIWLDAVAAILVGALVAKIGIELSWKCVQELLDTALPDEDVQAYTDTIMQVEGVLSVHSFKSRRMASQIMLEMHIQIAPYLSASEGHFIGDSAVYRLKAKFPDISHAIFHIDTYDDEAENYCQVLPNRLTISQHLFDLLDKHQSSELTIQRLILHYRTDTVEIDLLTDAATGQQLNLNQLQQTLDSELRRYAWFGGLSILSRHHLPVQDQPPS